MIRGKENNSYINFRNKVSDIYPDIFTKLDFKHPEIPQSKSNLIIFTEGKTDWKHLQAAFHGLKNDGHYQDHTIDFHQTEDDIGDTILIRQCKTFSLRKQQTPLFFIFDRDVKSTLKEVCTPEGGIKSWGHNVYSTAIPIPEHRKETPDISIELLYKDEEIKRYDSNDRRLYINTEFSPKSGRNNTLNLTCANGKHKSNNIHIIDDKVSTKKIITLLFPKVALPNTFWTKHHHLTI